MFRRCSCLDAGGKRNVCVPPRVGWMCKRSAVLIRMNITLESRMVERRRMQNERNRIKEAEQAAEKVARDYLKTEEGALRVRKLAEEKLSQVHGKAKGTDMTKRNKVGIIQKW